MPHMTKFKHFFFGGIAVLTSYQKNLINLIVAVKPPQQRQGWVTSLWQLVPFVRSQDFRPDGQSSCSGSSGVQQE